MFRGAYRSLGRLTAARRGLGMFCRRRHQRFWKTLEGRRLLGAGDLDSTFNFPDGYDRNAFGGTTTHGGNVVVDASHRTVVATELTTALWSRVTRQWIAGLVQMWISWALRIRSPAWPNFLTVAFWSRAASYNGANYDSFVMHLSSTGTPISTFANPVLAGDQFVIADGRRWRQHVPHGQHRRGCVRREVFHQRETPALGFGDANGFAIHQELSFDQESRPGDQRRQRSLSAETPRFRRLCCAAQ